MKNTNLTECFMAKDKMLYINVASKSISNRIGLTQHMFYTYTMYTKIFMYILHFNK